MNDVGTRHALPVLGDEEMARGRPSGDEPGVGTLVTERGNLPLEALAVRARITGLLAEVALTQTFVNRFDLPLEATYVFPLPDRAAVTEFRMEAGDRVVEGVLRERAEARAAYDQAVADGRLAAITEEERPGVFTMRVGNLPPGERAGVRLVMLGPLPYDQGEATFRFPLVVAPRYIPGTPLGWPWAGEGVQPDTDAVPDASRITPPVLLPGFPSPVRLDLEAEIDPGGLPAGEIRSSLHAIVVSERHGPGGRVRVVRAQPGGRPDRDFVLRLRVGSGALDASALAVPDADGERGTFTLTVMPPPAEAARPRDVALVLDRSGSMAGWKIVAARRAAARLVDSLCERDRLTVLAFAADIQRPSGPEGGGPWLEGGAPRGPWLEGGAPGGPWPGGGAPGSPWPGGGAPGSPWPGGGAPRPGGGGPRPATDRERFRAVEFLARLHARGGTEMAAPLIEALEQLGDPQPDRDRILVLVSDGQVGNEDQILRLLAPRLGGVRVYAVGIDTAVNEGFLRRLAIAGGGACELVESEDRLDEALDRIRQRIGTPVATDLELDADGLGAEPGSITPARLPALLAGVPLVVRGRYRGRPGGALVLRGRRAAGEPWRVTVPVVPAGGAALAKLWARAHVRDLEDRYAAGAVHDDRLERRIVRTCLDFGVLSRFTAFVAMGTEVVNRDGRPHRVTQPVDVPHGWEWPGAGSEACVPFTAAGGFLSMETAVAHHTMPSPASRHRPRPAVELPGLPVPPAPPTAGARRGRRFWRAGPEGLAATTGDDLAASDGLDAYRRRAAELARELRATLEPALGPRLGAMAARLAALVADLESVGADPSAIQPLRDLVAALAGPSGDPRGLRDRAVEALLEFAREGP